MDHLPIQQFLNFLPLPQGHGSLRPAWDMIWVLVVRVWGICCRRHTAAISATKGRQWVKKRL